MINSQVQFIENENLQADRYKCYLNQKAYLFIDMKFPDYLRLNKVCESNRENFTNINLKRVSLECNSLKEVCILLTNS